MLQKFKKFSILTGILLVTPLTINTSLVTTSHATAPIISNSIAPLINNVIPAVVSVVAVSQRQVNVNPFQGLLPDNFLPKGFNNQTETQHYSSQGSGVIIDARTGYIITNNHVIAGADQIRINLNDGRSYKAKVKGADPKTDLAVLEITDKFKNLSQATFGNSDTMRIGDFVAAIGNPFGIGLTATTGIVSALSRNAQLNEFESYIQTDAAINRGNSGGALINMDGQVIGINSAILATDGGSVGIGFAIPSNIAKSISNQLIKKGRVDRSTLGVIGGNLTSDIASSLDINITQGAFVNEVVKGSPADKAGIKSGDVIVGINGVPIINFNQLRATISSTEPGTEIELTIINKNKERKVKVVLDPQNTLAGEQHKNITKHEKIVSAYGISFTISDKGVVISAIQQQSPFASSGLQQGDIVQSINSQEVKSLDNLTEILKKNQEFLAFQVRRDNSELYVFLRLNDR